MKKERPILFSTPMVQALLDESKTVTRRVNGLDKVNESPLKWRFCRFNGSHAIFCESSNSESQIFIKCPYGRVGDALWVREKWENQTSNGKRVNFFAGNIEVQHNPAYRNLTKWKPSIHLKKVDARLWLQIKHIGVERLQSISEPDAVAEGIYKRYNDLFNEMRYKDYLADAFPANFWRNPVSSFKSLWQLVNGLDAWDKNPWVWVIRFDAGIVVYKTAAVGPTII